MHTYPKEKKSVAEISTFLQSYYKTNGIYKWLVLEFTYDNKNLQIT